MVKKLRRLNKKGLSTIVVTMILIALSMAAVVIVWAFVNSLIKNQISQSQSCFGNFDKIKLNGQYTCYERNGDNYTFRFSLIIGDIKVDKVLVAVSSAGTTKSYQITNTPKIISGLVMYSGSNPENVSLPERNAGLTYNATGFSSPIDSVQIAPVFGENVCEVSDSITEVTACTL